MVAANFLERSPGWDFPCLARSANYLCGESWEALGPQRPGQLSIVTKIALLGEGRYFLWLRFPLRPAWATEERGKSQRGRRTGTWLGGWGGALRGGSPVTKGGNEYAESVIILYASQCVFPCVISIVKLPKQETDDTTSLSGSWRRKEGTGALPKAHPPITRLPSGRNSLMTDWLFAGLLGAEAASSSSEPRGVEFQDRDAACGTPRPARNKLGWAWGSGKSTG